MVFHKFLKIHSESSVRVLSPKAVFSLPKMINGLDRDFGAHRSPELQV